MTKADLVDAQMERAVLNGAKLVQANLKNARVDDSQLDQAGSMSGATMPDGRVHGPKK